MKYTCSDFWTINYIAQFLLTALILHKNVEQEAEQAAHKLTIKVSSQRLKQPLPVFFLMINRAKPQLKLEQMHS